MLARGSKRLSWKPGKANSPNLGYINCMLLLIGYDTMCRKTLGTFSLGPNSDHVWVQTICSRTAHPCGHFSSSLLARALASGALMHRAISSGSGLRLTARIVCARWGAAHSLGVRLACHCRFTASVTMLRIYKVVNSMLGLGFLIQFFCCSNKDLRTYLD